RAEVVLEEDAGAVLARELLPAVDHLEHALVHERRAIVVRGREVAGDAAALDLAHGDLVNAAAHSALAALPCAHERGEVERHRVLHAGDSSSPREAASTLG